MSADIHDLCIAEANSLELRLAKARRALDDERRYVKALRTALELTMGPLGDLTDPAAVAVREAARRVLAGEIGAAT